jgi:hypothetical protein
MKVWKKENLFIMAILYVLLFRAVLSKFILQYNEIL